MGTRTALLVVTIAVATLAVACGRASEADINQALGITPVPTVSAEQRAAESAAAAASASARSAAAAMGSQVVGAAPQGDVTVGRRQFTTLCAGCHRAGGAGPDILAPGSAGAGLTYETLLPLLREGTGHPVPPGPFPATRLSDAAIAGLAAYIQQQAGS